MNTHNYSPFATLMNISVDASEAIAARSKILGGSIPHRLLVLTYATGLI